MKDLIKLYTFESVYQTEDEQGLYDYLKQKLKDMGVRFQSNDLAIWYLNHKNNTVYSAHIDQVKTQGPAKHFYQDGNMIKGYTDDMKRTSLGADDKNGVWLILNLIKKFGNNINFCFTKGEEVGCVGINSIYKEISQYSTWNPKAKAIVLDRRGYHEILQYGGSTKYCDILARFMCNQFGYEWNVGSGSVSDTQTFCKYMEAVNVSTAYYSPHSSNEYTNWKELNELLDKLITFEETVSPLYVPTPIDKWQKEKTNERDLFNYRS